MGQRIDRVPDLTPEEWRAVLIRAVMSLSPVDRVTLRLPMNPGDFNNAPRDGERGKQ